MTDERKRRTSGWFIGATTVLVLLAGYLGGYFALGHYGCEPTSDFDIHVRSFSHASLITFYYPMGWIESRIRGEPVMFLTPNSPSRDRVDPWFDPR